MSQGGWVREVPWEAIMITRFEVAGSRLVMSTGVKKQINICILRRAYCLVAIGKQCLNCWSFGPAQDTTAVLLTSFNTLADVSKSPRDTSYFLSPRLSILRTRSHIRGLVSSCICWYREIFRVVELNMRVNQAVGFMALSSPLCSEASCLISVPSSLWPIS